MLDVRREQGGAVQGAACTHRRCHTSGSNVILHKQTCRIVEALRLYAGPDCTPEPCRM